MSIKGCGADLEPPLPECSWCNWYLQHVQRNADQDGQAVAEQEKRRFGLSTKRTSI